jgi:lipopolysaccharide export system protein LptA
MIVRFLGFSTVLLFAALAAAPGFAQAPGNSLAAGYAANSDKPINIEADSLEVNDQQKTATFVGNVTATQGDFSLKAKQIEVSYVAKGGNDAAATAPAGPGGDSQITEINAKGKVLVTTQGDQTGAQDRQTATSDWARFDVPAQLVTIGGNVVLTQGLNTIRGDRLVIDLKTGLSRFENSTETADGAAPKQRLRAIFSPNAKPAPGN